jgi:hypothetical protein
MRDHTGESPRFREGSSMGLSITRQYEFPIRREFPIDAVATHRLL